MKNELSCHGDVALRAWVVWLSEGERRYVLLMEAGSVGTAPELCSVFS